MKRLIYIISTHHHFYESRRTIAIHSRNTLTVAAAMFSFKPEEIFGVFIARAKPFHIITIPRPESPLTDVIFRSDTANLQDIRRIISLLQLQNLVKLAQENSIMMDHKPCSIY